MKAYINVRLRVSVTYCTDLVKSSKKVRWGQSMKAQARTEREAQIAEAAYTVLAEKGFSGMSMLAIAKAAKASNETLYRWYGDKTGLFRALITRNASDVSERLDEILLGGGAAEVALETMGAALLDMLLSDRAISLNRAAAADPGNSLGQVLAEAGRGAVFPRLVQLFVRLRAKGRVDLPAPEAAALWVDLLVGDWQVRMVTGAMPPPDAEARAARVQRAVHMILR